MSLRRLICDREIEFFDGTRLLSAEKYEALAQALGKEPGPNVLRIHPAFRIIATAEPPAQDSQWLNSETLGLFLYQNLPPLETNYERQVLSNMFKLNAQHERLFELLSRLEVAGHQDTQLRHVAKLFSLRKKIRLCKKLEKHPSMDLVELVKNASLYQFMPQVFFHFQFNL